MLRTGIVTKKAIYLEGEKVTDFIFENSMERGNACILWNDTTLVLFDKEEKMKLLEIKDNIADIAFQEHYFIVYCKNEECDERKFIARGAYNYKGDMLIEPFKYDNIFSYDKVIVANNEKYSLFTLGGKPFAEENEFDFVLLHGSEIIVKKDGKCGIYSCDGKILLPFSYDDVLPTSLRGTYKVLYPSEEEYVLVYIKNM